MGRRRPAQHEVELSCVFLIVYLALLGICCLLVLLGLLALARSSGVGAVLR